MKLIVNADDFGLCEGVTYGIYDSIKRGIVSSTTMMVNMRASRLAGKIIRNDNELSVGLHINICLGKPLTNAITLTCNGEFIKPKKADIHNGFMDKELDMELEAQYQEFCMLTGKEPTHIDSHLYTHQIYDNVKTAVIRLADFHKIPVREFGTRYYKAIEYDGNFKVKESDNEKTMIDKFLEIIIACEKKYDELEVLAHPGFIDKFLLDNSSYNLQRTLEHRTLISEKLKEFIFSKKIELTGF